MIKISEILKLFPKLNQTSSKNNENFNLAKFFGFKFQFKLGHGIITAFLPEKEYLRCV